MFTTTTTTTTSLDPSTPEVGRPPRRIVTPTHPRLRSRRVPVLAYVAGLLLIGGTVVVGSQLVGVWQTSGKTTAGGAKVAATGADPAEVKGWMTLASVIDAYHVDEAALFAQFGIPVGTPTSTALKDLEGVATAFSVTDLRSWLAAQMPTP